MRQTRFLVVVTLILLLGFALRVISLSNDSLWSDETFTAFFAGAPAAEFVSLLLTDGVHVPLYFSLMRALLNQPTPFVDAGHNLWAGLWPFQVPAGVLLITMGMRRRDERLLIAGTPFLSPYAALSSFAGPWIAAITWLSNWQAAVVFASWWGAVIARAMGV